MTGHTHVPYYVRTAGVTICETCADVLSIADSGPIHPSGENHQS